MTKYIEVTANFVIPEGTAVPFVNMLERAVDSHVFPRLITQEFYYYGVWQDEWLSAGPPTPQDAVAFSLGITPESVVALVHEDVVVEIENSGDIARAIRSLNLRELQDFSREKKANFATNDGTIMGDYMPERSSHSHVIPSPEEEYQRGYAEGFEAGGGCVSEDLSREKITQEEADDPVTLEAWEEFVLKEQAEEDVELARDKFYQSLSFQAWHKKFSREKSSPRVDLIRILTQFHEFALDYEKNTGDSSVLELVHQAIDNVENFSREKSDDSSSEAVDPR